MSKLVVNQLTCTYRTDDSGDDPYILIMRVGPDSTVVRADSPAWTDIDDAVPIKTQVVLVNDFHPNSTYVIAIIDQDDGNDFNSSTLVGMSSAMKIAYQKQALIQKDPNLLAVNMMNLFRDVIQELRTNDDLLHIQLLTTTQPIEVSSQGAQYKLTLSVIN